MTRDQLLTYRTVTRTLCCRRCCCSVVWCPSLSSSTSRSCTSRRTCCNNTTLWWRFLQVRDPWCDLTFFSRTSASPYLHWDMMLVWRKGTIKKTASVYSIVNYCNDAPAVVIGRSTISGFDLAWFSFLSYKRVCIFDLSAICIVNSNLKTHYFRRHMDN